MYEPLNVFTLKIVCVGLILSFVPVRTSAEFVFLLFIAYSHVTVLRAGQISISGTPQLHDIFVHALLHFFTRII